MKFLTDVNASGALARWLLERGYDVLRVTDVDSRMEDSRILQWAWREKRALITTDQDFEEMVWRERNSTMAYCALKIYLVLNVCHCWNMS